MFTNEHGAVSRGRFQSDTQVVATDWGNLAGTLNGGDIEWANGTVWEATAAPLALNPLDELFSNPETDGLVA